MKANSFFTTSLDHSDSFLFSLLEGERNRQHEHIELIASENFVSQAVLQAQGSVLTNKYAEGYPSRRYYGGCEFVDKVESLAIKRLKELFKCGFANVQPHSGAQANQAVFLALLNPGDKVMGMSLSAGGHLTHGSKVNLSGKWFDIISYGVHPETYLIDYDEVQKIALEHKPKLIIAGGSAYPRKIDFARFREIADSVGAYLMVDMAHYAGLIAADLYPTPLPYAHVVTSTTHKTLRGPRGGIILTNDEEISKKINSAVFPGLQGGPLMHVIAAKAVAFKEALEPSFKAYAQNVVNNAQTLSNVLQSEGIPLISGGTDSHLLLVDLRSLNINGKDAEAQLERAHITCNKNGIPFDPLPPLLTSGIRLGTPACTTRGFKEEEFKEIGCSIVNILKSMANDTLENTIENVKDNVKNLCDRFPLYERCF